MNSIVYYRYSTTTKTIESAEYSLLTWLSLHRVVRDTMQGYFFLFGSFARGGQDQLTRRDHDVYVRTGRHAKRSHLLPLQIEDTPPHSASTYFKPD